MTVAAAFGRVRDALVQVQQRGQQLVDVKALLTYMASIEASASVDSETRRLEHEARLAQFKAEQEASLAHYKAIVESNTEMFRSVMESSKTALTAGILVNGGATVALLAFLSTLASKGAAVAAIPPTAFVVALIAFAMGVLAGAMATGATYCAQYCYHHEHLRSATAFHVIVNRPEFLGGSLV